MRLNCSSSRRANPISKMAIKFIQVKWEIFYKHWLLYSTHTDWLNLTCPYLGYFVKDDGYN
jgi:hypothetical protein